MRTTLKLFAVAVWFFLTSNAVAGNARSKLLELRSLAYDANFKNDAAKLRRLSQELGELATDPSLGSAGLYYAGWTDWALFNSEYDAGRKDEANAAVQSAVERLKRAVEMTPEDAEAQAMLANALIGKAFTTPDGFRVVRDELVQARRKALELGPTSPRVVLMDAGMVFGTPPQFGGSQEKGLERWMHAIELFEAEARSHATNGLRPRWGLPLAYGWLSQLYLSMTPPHTAEAKQAASHALSLRPDFWYVKERILPRLKD